MDEVAGERTAALGKIITPAFSLETPDFHWEESSFRYNDKSVLPFRLIELPNKSIPSAEDKNLLSRISLITEINLE